MWDVYSGLPYLILLVSGSIGEASDECSYAQRCKDEICDGTGCTKGCKDGYYGPQCRYNCTGNCMNNRCNASEFGAVSCKDGCKDGFWGKTCTSKCPHVCKRCNNDVSCSECDGFHHGPKCAKDCRGTCSVFGCHSDGTCRQDNHTMSSCGSNCLLCNDTSVICSRCRRNYAGKKCDVYCGNCAGSCSADGCLEGCSPGHRGPYCEDSCSRKCSVNICDQESGECLKGCVNGYHGLDCSKICPSRCIRDICHQHSGQCRHGCQNGYYGPSCKRICENCFDDTCNRSTGQCLYGCSDGKYGLDCNQECSPQCQSRRCRREDGACLIGEGTNSTPKTTSGKEAVGTNVYFILASLGIFLLCVVAAGILMIRYCRSPCLTRLNRTDPPPSRSLPDPPPLQPSRNMYSVIYEDQMDSSAQSMRSNTLTRPALVLPMSNIVSPSKDEPEQCVFSTSGQVLQMPSPCDEQASEYPEQPNLCASPEPDSSTYESLSGGSHSSPKQRPAPRPYITPVSGGHQS
ncbi:scavenger receptor class F member 1-like [Haliotis asinina]|uniref:scavenger receptor class F member 1-like n=1 Tax=Haliotis asinina TaxID=109174 RepID=UPI003531C3CF